MVNFENKKILKSAKWLEKTIIKGTDVKKKKKGTDVN